MKTRHMNELLSCLEDVMCRGVAIIPKDKLKLWYGAERLSAGVFADIEDKWQHELDQQQPLLVCENDAELIFIHGEGIQTTGSRIVNIKERSKTKASRKTEG